VHAHAKMLTIYQHGKLSLEPLRFLARVKENDDCPLPSPCISVEKDWKGGFGCGKYGAGKRRKLR
jgi:hypothetical protein